MSELPYIDNPEILKKEIKRLRDEREKNKTKNKNKTKIARKYSLTQEERAAIWEKTDGNCHICGRAVEIGGFEADHVRNHAGGGSNQAENFLAACETCNNYRWNYSSEEIQWILKIGVWAKTKIEHDDKVGKGIAENFIKKEVEREKRRKNPRVPLE